MSCTTRRVVPLALFCCAIGAPVLDARPPYKKALEEQLGANLAKKLNDCTLCHLPAAGNAALDETERPHNAYGERLAHVRAELRKAGKGVDILDRIAAIANEDVDGDGVTNALEIFSGRFPGDAKDVPTAGEQEAGRRALAAYQQRSQGYAWKPFEPVRRPTVPTVKDVAWSSHPLDRFIAAEHEKQGLTPRPEAAPHVLLRRVYLDIIGLPPTAAETADFLRACAQHANLPLEDPGFRVPDAVYEKLIDRLLNSPHYGERWGRHWMDIWRYSDWAGYRAEVRDSQPHIWRWRDWIIEALNADKPYDRMILEMLAGDEIAPLDREVLRATGYLVRNWYKYNRDVWLDRTVEHTGKAFLGITMNCARCHDHFFDAISQKEYYQFRAFFEPHDIRTDRVPGSPDPSKDGLVRVYDAKLTQPTFLYIRGEDKNPDKSQSLEPAPPSLLGGAALTIASLKLPAEAVHPEKQAWVIKDLLDGHQAALEAAKGALAKADKAQRELAELEVELASARLAALQAVLHVEGLEERSSKGPAWEKAAIETTRLQQQAKIAEARKNARLAEQTAAMADLKKQPALKKKLDEALAILSKAEEEAKKPATTAYTKRLTSNYPATSTGRRLALARWIANPQNPLTARVAVNHIWLRHFGKPLAPNAFDFGGNSKPPSHPALLDWLATEFMESGWSMKALHRIILTSAAYRMDSIHDAASAAKDPDNRWLWRMNHRRMEAEIVRDSVLAAAGQLDRTMGGPEIDQTLGLATKRRSLYYRYAPEKMMEFLTLFDSPNVTECYERTESVVPQQALALANSSLVLAQSRLLTRELMKPLGTAAPSNSARFVEAAFQHILGRAPSAEEQSACELFLANQSTLLANPSGLQKFAGAASSDAVPPASDPQLRAREGLVHVLLNHNEFVTIR